MPVVDSSSFCSLLPRNNSSHQPKCSSRLSTWFTFQDKSNFYSQATCCCSFTIAVILDPNQGDTTQKNQSFHPRTLNWWFHGILTFSTVTPLPPWFKLFARSTGADLVINSTFHLEAFKESLSLFLFLQKASPHPTWAVAILKSFYVDFSIYRPVSILGSHCIDVWGSGSCIHGSYCWEQNQHAAGIPMKEKKICSIFSLEMFLCWPQPSLVPLLALYFPCQMA